MAYTKLCVAGLFGTQGKEIGVVICGGFLDKSGKNGWFTTYGLYLVGFIYMLCGCTWDDI